MSFTSPSVLATIPPLRQSAEIGHLERITDGR
jgi:hypothetical protein